MTEAVLNVEFQAPGGLTKIKAVGGDATIQEKDDDGVWGVIDSDLTPSGVLSSGATVLVYNKNVPMRFSAIAGQAFYW